jgi:hypothetical protein
MALHSCFVARSSSMRPPFSGSLMHPYPSAESWSLFFFIVLYCIL